MFNRALPWILAAYIAFVFVQSLFFKFTGSEETRIIFETIGAWLADSGVPQRAASAFAEYGGWAVGLTELCASILLLLPRTRVWGALLALGVISGAIFFHLFTPLGVVRTIDAAGHTDGGVLFAMACGVWIASALTLWLNRRAVPGVA